MPIETFIPTMLSVQIKAMRFGEYRTNNYIYVWREYKDRAQLERMPLLVYDYNEEARRDPKQWRICRIYWKDKDGHHLFK